MNWCPKSIIAAAGFICLCGNIQAETLKIFSGNFQSAQAGAKLSIYPLEAAVTDDAGKPLKNTKMAFSVVKGGGSILPDKNGNPVMEEVLSDDSGIARIFLTLGGAPGTNRVKATIGGSEVVFEETGLGTVFNDDFQGGGLDGSKWEEYFFLGNGAGAKSASGKNMKLSLSNKEAAAVYGMVSRRPFEGSFISQADFDCNKDKKHCEYGIMLVKNSGGRPDFGNFVNLYVGWDKKRTVNRYAVKNGVKQKVFTYSEEKHYFPVYKIESSGALRIIRDSSTSSFRFYHRFEKKVNGVDCTGWKELESLADWGPEEGFLYLWVASSPEKCAEASAAFDNVLVSQQPVYDNPDFKTGFRATKRDYTFSGITSEAVVVTFDEAFDEYENLKFVFWRDANFIPWWHLDNMVAFTCAFMECWGGGTVGCNEPMSDRLCRWSNAEIIESSKARVVVRWHYILSDINYYWWGLGAEQPTVDEYYYFYPDGVGVRKIDLKPLGMQLHEVAEFEVISAGGRKPDQNIELDALTLYNLEGKKDTYTWDLKHDCVSPDFNEDTWNWKEAVGRMHLKDRPDPFFASISVKNKNAAELWPMAPLRPDPWPILNNPCTGKHFKADWNNTSKQDEYGYNFMHLSHWPVSKRPYEREMASGSHSTREVSHSCFTSWKVAEYPEKETEYAALIGANSMPDEYVSGFVKAWLYPGEIKTNSENIFYQGYDYFQRAYVLTDSSAAMRDGISFVLACAGGSAEILRNPVFIIKGCKLPQEGLTVSLNGAKIDGRYCRQDFIKGDMLLWLGRDFTGSSVISISR